MVNKDTKYFKSFVLQEFYLKVVLIYGPRHCY